MTRRVVVTGIGVVTPLGSDLDSFRGRLLEGISAAAPITVFDPASLPTRIAAQVNAETLPLKTKDRKVAFGVLAGRLAVDDANEAKVPLNRHYALGSGGLNLGIGLELFSMPDMVQFLNDDSNAAVDTQQKSLDFVQTPSDICLHWIAQEHDLRQPPIAHISACAASTDAIGTAFRMIRDGERAWMLAGGADSMINPLGVGGFCKIGAMTTRNQEPSRASRPFDRDRDGFLLGEGAGILILESLDEALKRGAAIYAEIGGYGTSFDAHGISEPHPEGDGALLAMQRALMDAGIGPQEIFHINAHGTSTPKNDPVETRAIKRLLGSRAGEITVNSTKSMIGHLISAAGAVETAALLVTAGSGWVHPTINLENPDPQCDLDYVAQGPKKARPGWYLKNSFGFGGQNASLALRLTETGSC